MIYGVVFLQVRNELVACLGCLLELGLTNEQVHVLVHHVGVEHIVVAVHEQLGVQSLVQVGYPVQFLRVIHVCFFVFIQTRFSEFAHSP